VGWGDNEEVSAGGWADDEPELAEDSTVQTNNNETKATDELIPKREETKVPSSGIGSASASARIANSKKEKSNPKPPTRLVAEKKAVSLSFDDFEDENK